MNKDIKTVDDYIATFPKDIGLKLEAIRQIILANAPDVIEKISYGMPSYKTNNKPLVYFGGFAKHIGLYATPAGHEAFKEQLSIYKRGKGSVQFPLNEPLPVNLITDIVKFRISENNRK